MSTMVRHDERSRTRPCSGSEIDDLLLQLRGLVLVASCSPRAARRADELDAHGREAERVRHRLAELIGAAE